MAIQSDKFIACIKNMIICGAYSLFIAAANAIDQAIILGLLLSPYL
jgi:hypothetical protein